MRGRVGVIHEHHGAHVFPDLNAEGVEEGRHLYNVRFEASELWGETAKSRASSMSIFGKIIWSRPDERS